MKLVILSDEGKAIHEVEIPADYYQAVCCKRVDSALPEKVKVLEAAKAIIRNGITDLNDYKREGSIWWDWQLTRTGWTAEKARNEGLKALASAPDRA